MKTRLNTLLVLAGCLATGMFSSCTTYVEPAPTTTVGATTTTTTRSVDPYAGSTTTERKTTTTAY